MLWFAFAVCLGVMIKLTLGLVIWFSWGLLVVCFVLIGVCGLIVIDYGGTSDCYFFGVCLLVVVWVVTLIGVCLGGFFVDVVSIWLTYDCY